MKTTSFKLQQGRSNLINLIRNNFFTGKYEHLKKLLLDCLLGLDHLASHKLHHLDLKPENILKMGNCYLLTDFGSIKKRKNFFNISKAKGYSFKIFNYFLGCKLWD